ncbi:TPA: hypothetical protein SD903_000708 [Campylobacter jejuni]|nr:hypothetical protein [Campylobacter jejuni]
MMTCYLHIGTVKTGTTTIQNFLENNREFLKQQGYYYPHFYSNLCSYKLPKIFKVVQEDVYYNACVAKTEYEQKSELERLKNEIINSKLNTVILSSECIHEFSFEIHELQKLKNALHNIGFKKIYIIIYIRNPFDLMVSFYNTELLLNRKERYSLFEDINKSINYGLHIANHKKTLQNYIQVFKKNNLIVRIFEQDEFYNQNLLKDFIFCLKAQWSNNFIASKPLNETINLLGIEMTRYINLYINNSSFLPMLQKHFSFKDLDLKFLPQKKIYHLYNSFFSNSNEWVRKEFFPHKERLFQKKDINIYKENYELKEMKPEYWDRIANFIVDLTETKNKTIQNLTNDIQNKTKDLFLKEGEIKKQKQNLIIFNKQLIFHQKYGFAKTRIKNHLSYKLGKILINSKILSLPILLSIIIIYKWEQKFCKNNFNSLPPLETYPDYNEALKEKECFTYKLGEAFIRASKNWHKGGYIKFYFKDVPRLKREIKEK